MFRKAKRKAKASIRRKDDDLEENDDDGTAQAAEATTNELLEEARKRLKPSKTGSLSTASQKKEPSSSSVMHTFDTSKSNMTTSADLATSTAQHFPEKKTTNDEGTETAKKGTDGIFRNKQRNKFHAGPIKAAQNIRVTARFDYEPNICKDYKETGFCGFGDTCIYLHDRGDTMSGWQLEQQWEEQQKRKREQQEKEIQGFVDGKTIAGDDGKLIAEDALPFACFLCREYFKDPVVTTCNHYFCEKCIMDHVRRTSDSCPVCSQDTGSVFNQPTKLLSKKRKVLGIIKSKRPDSWKAYSDAMSNDNAASE